MNNHTTQYINPPVRPSVCQRTGVCMAKELFLIRGVSDATINKMKGRWEDV